LSSTEKPNLKSETSSFVSNFSQYIVTGFVYKDIPVDRNTNVDFVNNILAYMYMGDGVWVG